MDSGQGDISGRVNRRALAPQVEFWNLIRSQLPQYHQSIVGEEIPAD
jgi:hypothetical protein